MSGMGVLRWLVVTVGVMMLSTLGINAFDNIDTPSRSLIGAAFSGYTAVECPKDMARVSTSDGDFCIDKYENSAGEGCFYKDPSNKSETDNNLFFQKCIPQSVNNATPWRNISRQQAELACARAGKRLPTNVEWYKAALGTPDKNGGWDVNDCNVNDSSVALSGSRILCVSVSGAYDMIGNVWEWLEETVTDGSYSPQILFPEQGYITSITDDGVPIETNLSEPDQAYFEDYFWLDKTNVRGMLRGGYWKSKSDAGQYAVNVTVPPSFSSDAVGFRCVKNLE